MSANQQSDRSRSASAAEKRATMQIGECLRKGCVICIEHSPSMGPRFSPWEIWGKPSCYNGDKQKIFAAIDNCRETHADHHIRLNIEDFSFKSRFTVTVHDPVRPS